MKATKKSIMQRKQGGFIMTTELVLLTSVMVVGMVVGLVSMRDSVNAEMEDVAEAIGALDQSYSFDGIQNVQETAFIDGSTFTDAQDVNAGDTVGFTYTAPSIESANDTLGAAPFGSGTSSTGNSADPGR
ncbi:hypothetical protein [Spongiibacter thalassae]|uniref:hypothetical protein n=1 Tax=Spongiibacter thalassae TaxID=2721624 RepID=UPI001FF0D488|nr:hypothetical protein [Spongiibacter thalassae]